MLTRLIRRLRDLFRPSSRLERELDDELRSHVELPLILAAAIACDLPARRASRVDPNVALRDL